MKQLAQVTELIGHDAMVNGERQSACSSCAGKSSCSTLGGGWKERPVSMRVSNPLQAQVGDYVMVEVEDALILKASFRLYGVPLLAFLLAGSIGWLLGGWLTLGQDVVAAFFGILAVLATYYWIARNDRKLSQGMASIVEIIIKDTDSPI